MGDLEMAISENHEKMWELFDKVRFSKDLEECHKVIEEEMGPIVEEEEELKYYVDAANKICEILEHIEEEKNPEGENEDEERPEISSVEFKKVMAAISEPKPKNNKKYGVVAIPDRMHKGEKDDKVKTTMIKKFIKEVNGLLDGYSSEKPLYLVEKDGFYFISTSKATLTKPFTPAKFFSTGKRAPDKFTASLEVEPGEISRITDSDFLFKKLMRLESQKNISKKASFEDIMRGLV